MDNKAKLPVSSFQKEDAAALLSAPKNQNSEAIEAAQSPQNTQNESAAAAPNSPLYQTQIKQVKAPFIAAPQDKIFALIYLIIGYLYVRVQFHLRYAYNSQLGGAWVTVFTLIYAACVLCYMYSKGKKLTKAGAFWLCVFLAVGFAYALFKNAALAGFQGLFWHAAAAYFTLIACGGSVLPHTSDFFVFDILSALVIVPFANFFSGLRALFIFNKKPKPETKRQAGGIALGVVLLAVALAVILPLLSDADEGFAALTSALLSFDIMYNPEFWFYLFTALPIAAYLYGLIYGSLNKRGTNVFKADMLSTSGKARHIVPQNTVYIVLGGVAALYVMFILVQAPGIFTAFTGRLYGTSIYSTYAREGFFSLCRVAAINAALLFSADLFAKTPRSESAALRAFNTALSELTLIMLASACAKMLIYISVYGLTTLRIITLYSMAVLAVMFICVIIWQYRKSAGFSVFRVTVCFAAVLFCALALCNIDAFTAFFNANSALIAS